MTDDSSSKTKPKRTRVRRKADPVPAVIGNVLAELSKLSDDQRSRALAAIQSYYSMTPGGAA